MDDCEFDPACDRSPDRRLVIEYPRGATCEEYYCDGHARTVREEFDLDRVEVLAAESL